MKPKAAGHCCSAEKDITAGGERQLAGSVFAAIKNCHVLSVCRRALVRGMRPDNLCPPKKTLYLQAARGLGPMVDTPTVRLNRHIRSSGLRYIKLPLLRRHSRPRAPNCSGLNSGFKTESVSKRTRLSGLENYPDSYVEGCPAITFESKRLALITEATHLFGRLRKRRRQLVFYATNVLEHTLRGFDEYGPFPEIFAHVP